MSLGGYLVFDVETTGLARGCRVVEFAAVALDGAGTIVDRYETMVNPESPPGPTWLHGLDSEMLAVAPTFLEVAGDIQRLFRDRVPVAHNLRFDWGVLRRAYGLLGVEMPISAAGVCTAALSRRHLSGRRSLAHVCQRLRIVHTEPHRAGPDAEATAAILTALLARGGPALGRPCPPFAGAWRLPRSQAPKPRPAFSPGGGR